MPAGQVIHFGATRRSDDSAHQLSSNNCQLINKLSDDKVTDSFLSLFSGSWFIFPAPREAFAGDKHWPSKRTAPSPLASHKSCILKHIQKVRFVHQDEFVQDDQKMWSLLVVPLY